MKSPVSMLGGVIAFLLSAGPTAEAQWLIQHTGLPSVTQGPEVFVRTVSESVCWVVSFQVPMYSRTTDGGATWDASEVDAADGLKGSSIVALDGTSAWAAMSDPSYITSGGIFKTTNGGIDWERQASAFNNPGGFPNFVHFFDSDNGVCAGDPQNGYWEIYTTTDGGNQWNRVESSNIPDDVGELGIIGGYRAVGGSIWFVTNGSDLYRSTDRGYTWAVTRNVSSTAGFGFGFKDSLNGLSIGVPFARTTDGGATWSSFVPTIPPTGFFPFLGVVPTAGAWVIASPFAGSGGSAYTTDDGDTWTTIDYLLHGRTGFASDRVGWSAGVTDIIYKWDSELFTDVESLNHGVPESFRLDQNYPNPFNPSTTIRYELEREAGFVLTVHNELGQEIRRLVDDLIAPGSYTAIWDGRNRNGLPAASGIYFVRARANGAARTIKVVLTR
jgi:photosystem II stability/assembly factor-like uncharacterized protein